MQILNLESFKEMVNTNPSFKEKLADSDVISFDNGTMIIKRKNLNKYLEKYACKDEDDLGETMWYSYGMFVKVID